MRNVKLWIWPGLAAVACLSALAIWFNTGIIETDLRTRTMSALRLDHPWAQVLITGRDLTLSGLAPDEDSRDGALSLARNIYGVRDVSDASVLLPEEKPYKLSAEKTLNGITLSGFVPNESERANILSTLTGLLPGIAVSDQMKLARGAPAALVSLAGYGMSAFTRFSTGSVEITDGSMRVSGQALNPEDHEAALEILATIPPSAGILSAVEITPAKAQGDYIWSASKAAGGLKLQGYAPDIEIRKAIIARAKLIGGDLTVDDAMRFASGLPDGVDWLAAAETGLGVLENMSEGTVSMRGNILDVAGDALDTEAFRSIQDTLSTALPGGVVLGTADIGMVHGGSYQWAARSTAQGVELDGLVPDDAVHARILEAVRLKFGAAEITDNLVVEAGAVEGFEDAAMVALQALSRLDDGEVSLQDGMVSIRGSALYDAADQDVVRLMAEDLPSGFASETTIGAARETGSLLSAQACQTELNRLTASNSILFDTGEAAIQNHSYGFLDRVARAVKQCGDARLEISGHTDSDGTEADNIALSDRRAQAVIDFMTAAGVASSRLVGIGYGEGRPLESNETEEGKMANRRIEFKVLN